MPELDSRIKEASEKPLPRVQEVVEQKQPRHPLYCIRPATIMSICRQFMSCFNGDVLYATKCNTESLVLNAMEISGVRHFDCASLKEIEIVRKKCPSAITHFLHPIKSKEDIADAYFCFGVRTFALDSVEELNKITQATSHKNANAQDLTLLVRLALRDDPNVQYSVYPLSGKFGVVENGEACNLLKLARDRAQYLGICFHVGSQCMDPYGYTQALFDVSQIIAEAAVSLDIIDVGGGFSVSYPDMTPPHFSLYMANIEYGYKSLPSEFVVNARLWCEPGRALVAAGTSIVIRVEVEGRRSGRNILHVNDGIYGNLSELGVHRQWKFPYRLLRDSTAELVPFAFFGPTCDNADYMPGPFFLPSDTDTGDYIEIGQFGAYNTEIRTPFNGFDQTLVVEVRDPPMLVTPGLDDEQEVKVDE